jgi:uncharacterized membrane protein
MGAATLRDADRTRIRDAIDAAERGHRGEIIVHVEPRCFRDPLKRAAKLFHTLGADRTKEHTGVLLYIATASRRAAVWAGSGIDGGDDVATWRPVFAALEAGHASADPVGGICRAIEALGQLLATRAAGADTHGDELPDGVSS